MSSNAPSVASTSLAQPPSSAAAPTAAPQQPQPQQQQQQHHSSAGSSAAHIATPSSATSEPSHSFPPTAIGPYVTYPNVASADHLGRPQPGPQFPGRSVGAVPADAGSASGQPHTSASGSTAPTLPPHLYVPTASTSMSSSSSYSPFSLARNMVPAGGGPGPSSAGERDMTRRPLSLCASLSS